MFVAVQVVCMRVPPPAGTQSKVLPTFVRAKTPEEMKVLRPAGSR